MTNASNALWCAVSLTAALSVFGCAGSGVSGDPGGHGGDDNGSVTGGNSSGGGGGSNTGGGGASQGTTGGGGGRGGVAGSSGGAQGGGGAGSTTGGTGATVAGCAGASFCSGFEEAALPAGLSFFPEYQRANQNNFVALDTSVSHGGSKSVKVTGSDFSQMLAVAVPAPKFWVRVFLRSDTVIQEGHNTYVAATDGDGDPNAGQQVRIGEHECQLELNRKTDDKELLSNGGTYMCSGGTKLDANEWYCLEALYDGPGSEVRVFVDAEEITALHATGWGPYTYHLFKFGFEKYHGGAKTLWYDDLAVSQTRVGCQ